MQRQPHELPSSLIEAARVYQQEAQPISSFLDNIIDETKVTTYLAKVKPKGATDEELTDDVCVICGNPNCRTKNRPW